MLFILLFLVSSLLVLFLISVVATGEAAIEEDLTVRLNSRYVEDIEEEANYKDSDEYFHVDGLLIVPARIEEPPRHVKVEGPETGAKDGYIPKVAAASTPPLCRLFRERVPIPLVHPGVLRRLFEKAAARVE